MSQLIDEFLFPRRPTAKRPLLGQTVLVVEDSRYAGETMRLMCLRGGARIRRADSLKSAARHLGTYRPTVIVVDLGLPDGSGLDLITQLADSQPRVPVLLALSGDPSLERQAIDAGADEFLTKPFGTVGAFHNAILSRLPPEARPVGPRAVHDEPVFADQDALLDDFALVADLLDGQSDAGTLSYAVGFALGLGRSAGDDTLVAAAQNVEEALSNNAPVAAHQSQLAALVQKRLTPGEIAV